MLKHYRICHSFRLVPLAALLFAGCSGQATNARQDEQPAADTAEAAEPTFDVDKQFAANTLKLGAQNPTFIYAVPEGTKVEHGKPAHPKACTTWSLHPVAAVTVDRAGTYRYSGSRGDGVYIEFEDGKCSKLGDSQDGLELPAGTHRFWRQRNQPFSAILTDAGLAYDFGDLPTLELGQETGGIVTSVAQASARDMEDGLCGDSRGAPVAYVKVPNDRKQLEVQALDTWGTTRLFGPLEKQFDGVDLCTGGEKKAGTYAVFISGARTTGPQDVAIRVGKLTPEQQLQPIRPVPDTLELEERIFTRYMGAALGYARNWGARYYPTPAEDLFTVAPPQLFVFAGEAREGMTVNEPLLLIQMSPENKENAFVLRLDGVVREVPLASLKTEPTGEISMPKLAELERPKDMKEARRFALLREQPAVDKLQKAEFDFDLCFRGYMQRNDPTWNGNWKWVDVRTGQTTTAKIAKKASKKCKWSNVEKLEKQTLDNVFKARTAAQKDAVSALESKFR